MEVDYENIDLKLVCRTCLASDTEFYRLDAPSGFDEDKKTSFMESLRYCINLDDSPSFPMYICTACSKALLAAYSFIRNARTANDVLKQLLLTKTPAVRKEIIEPVQTTTTQEASPAPTECPYDRPMRCRMCGEKLHTKRALKEHVKLHMDMFTYKCQKCSLELKSKEELQRHYIQVHSTQPSQEMLKPIKNSSKKPIIKKLIKTEVPTAGDMVLHAGDINSGKIESMPNVHQSKQIRNQQQQQQQQLEPKLEPSLAEQLGLVDVFDDHNSNSVERKSLPITQDASALDTTTTTPLEATELTDFSSFTNFSNLNANESHQLSTANEFVVTLDGSLTKTENDVVIEYINAANGNLNLDSSIFFNNSVQFNPSDAAFLSNMNLDDMIIEESVVTDDSNAIGSLITDVPATTTTATTTTTTTTTLASGSNERTTNDFLDTEIKPIPSAVNVEDLLPPPTVIEISKKSSCKICSAVFASQELLKTHMLGHNGIPHFFCDKCSFYTFFRIDFTQHYKMQHNMLPNARLMQPRNKQKETPAGRRLFICDLCIFETNVKQNLRRHYQSKHKVEATEVQLRPTIDESDFACSEPEKKVHKRSQPDYPGGAQCKKCNKVFYWRENMRQHYSQHMSEDRSLNRLKQKNSLLQQRAQVQSTQKVQSPKQTQTQAQSKAQAAQTKLQTPPRQPTATPGFTTPPTTSIHFQSPSHFTTAQQTSSLEPPSPILQRDDPSNGMVVTVGDDFSGITIVDNIVNCITNATGNSTPIAILPHDLSTVVVSSESLPFAADTVVMTNDGVDVTNATLLDVSNLPNYVTTSTVEDAPMTDVDAVIASTVNEGIDFDFNGDALFEDFDDDEDEEQQRDDLDALHLTSEEENDEIDVVEDESRSYCMHCDKKFNSQYQFENHMFIHRGLAPYRCEMCTNLYNAKRALIRHYRVVHKKEPTRDMIQAKGDKVDKTPMEHLSLDFQKTKTLMCAKCPYESTNLQNLLIHLSSGHGLNNKKFIMQKLPFECPRCIRSFTSKSKLMLHLEHNHSAVPITSKSMEQRKVNTNSPPKSHSAAAANPTTPGIITTRGSLNNDEEEKASDVITESAVRNGISINQMQQQQQQQEQQHQQQHYYPPYYANISSNQTPIEPLWCDNMINLDEFIPTAEEVEIETETAPLQQSTTTSQSTSTSSSSSLAPLPTPPTSVEENDMNGYLNNWGMGKKRNHQYEANFSEALPARKAKAESNGRENCWNLSNNNDPRQSS